jgi:hypothetical protein
MVFLFREKEQTRVGSSRRTLQKSWGSAPERTACVGRLFLFEGFRGFAPGRRTTFVSAKVAKTIDAPSGLIAVEGRQP